MSPLTRDERDQLAASFRRFAKLECHGSSPLYERLSIRIASDTDVLELLSEATGTQRRPNLLFAAVHYLLLTGTEGQLRSWYPSIVSAPKKGDPWQDFRRFCLDHRASVQSLLSARRTQTNEVARCSLLRPAFTVIARRFLGLPVAFIDVGAAAGLNLLFDRYRYSYSGTSVGDPNSSVRLECEVRSGEPPIRVEVPEPVERIGIDFDPLDVGNDADVAWLRACIWPEHRRRMQTFDAAIGVARLSRPTLVKGDALDVLPGLLKGLPPDTALCIYHCATAAYLTDDERTTLAEIISGRGGDVPLGWVSMEGSGVSPVDRLVPPSPSPDPGAALLGLSLLEPGHREDQFLGWGDFHGRWIAWEAPLRHPTRRSDPARD